MEIPLRNVVFCILGVLASASLIACNGEQARERDESGVVVEGGKESVFALQPGDCYQDSADLYDGSGASTIPVVPCDEPHDNEVYLAFSLEGEEYPGQFAVLDQVTTRCGSEFETYVGLPLDESELDITFLVPTPGSWNNGDRAVQCAVFARDLSKLTGSMRGARI